MTLFPVRGLDISQYRVPLNQTLEDSTQRINSFEFVTVTVDVDGVQGVGWAYTTGLGGTGVVALLEEAVAPTLLGSDGSPIDAWTRTKAHLTRGGWGQYSALALAAVDIALWDSLARRSGLALHSVLGGEARACATYGSGVDLADTPAQLKQRLNGTLAEGHNAAKIKVGRDRQADRIRLATARECIGSDRDLFVDANQAWDVYEFQRRLPDMVEFGVSFIEEPFAPSNLAAYRRAASVSPIPLAAGETINDASEFMIPVSEGLWQILQPDVCRIGGITPWLRVARMAELWNLSLTSHFVIELAAHLASVSPAMKYVEITDHNLSHLGVSIGGIDFGGGVSKPTSEPGHGVELQFDPSHVIQTIELTL